MKLAGAATALAMIGLREIRKLEVDGESFGDFVGLIEFHPGDDGADLFHQIDVEFQRCG